MAGSQFKIRVGTELDASNLKSQLNAITKNQKIKLKIEVDGIDSVNKSLKKLKNQTADISVKPKVDTKSATSAVSQIEKQFEKIKSTKIQTNIESDFYKIQTAAQNLGKYATKGLNDAVMRADELLVKLKTADKSDMSGAIHSYQEFTDVVRTARLEIQRSNEAMRQAEKNMRLQQKKTAAIQNSDLWLQDNPKIKGTKLEDQIIQYRIEIDASQSVKEIDLLNAKLKSVQKEAQLQGLTGNTFFGNLASKAKEVASYLATFGPMWEIQQGIQQMAQNVLEVDTAMTGLYRVTDMTEKEYDQLYSNMISSAREYGATLTDTINATSDWIRAGFENPQQALDLGGITAMYQHVSDLDYDEATKNLVTAYNGFKDTFKETFAGDDVAAVEHVADVYNELDNQFSITSAGLGEGLARSASALELAGNTFEEAAALVGATAEVTQDPEKAGNAMKVLSLRLRGMKGQLEELGEDSEGVENISKMQGQILNLTKGKVNIFGDNGEFKSTYDIMRDISEVYNDMTDTDRASLLETIAGKDRANDVAALLGNMDNAVAMVETAENAVGSASRENEKYLESLQGRIEVMQGSFQALSNVVIDSDFLKGGVSAIDNIIKAVTILIQNLGLLPTALAAVATGFALFGKKAISFDDATNSVRLFGKELGSIKNIFGKNGLGGLFSGDKSLIDFGLDSFESELDKKKKQINKDVAALKKYQDIQMSTEMPDYQKKVQSDVQLSKMTASAKEYATSIDAANLDLKAFVDSEMQLEIQAELTSKSLRSQLTLLKEYNSAQKKGAGARTGKTTKEISEQVDGTELGSTVVGSIIAGAKGGEVKVGKALGSLVAKGAKNALKGLAGTVASAFTSILGGLIANFAIDGLFNGIEWLLDNTVNKAKKAAEAVEAMNEKFAETQSTLSNSKQVVSEYGDLYSELSKGVNTKTNENIGLSTDEYSQYLDIVNQISQTFPELISGYDAQGNAILTCAGNLNILNEAYNAQAIEKYNEVLKESDSAFDDFANKRKDLEAGFFDNIGAFFDSADLNMDGYKKLKEMMSSETGESIDDIVDSLTWGESDDIYEALDKAGANFDSLLSVNDNIKNVAKEQPELVRQVISGFESSMSAASEGLKNIAQAYIGKAFAEGDYSNISDSMQTVLTNAISGLDYDFFSQFDSRKDMEAELDNILSAFNSLNDADKKTMEMSFDLQTKLNNGDISVSEYLSSIENVGSIIDSMNLDKETKKALRLQFDIDDNYVREQYDNLTKELTKNGFAESEVKSWLDSLSGTDLSIAATLDIEGKDSIQDLQEALDLAKALQGVGSIDIAVETEGFEKLNTAIAESNSAIGLSQESIDAVSNRYANLEGFDPAAIFEKTTTGVRLNTQALDAMENQLIATNKAANAKNLSILAKRAKELEESISAANAAGEDTSGFEAQLEAIRESIQDAQMAAAAYDGLTSAYKGWIDAQSAGQQGDMYNSILAGIENATELANANKWGNTELQEFIKMFSGEGSMDTATPQQFADAWGSAISKAQRYFAEGTQGIDNFFADIQAKNAELLTEENGMLNFAPNVEVEDVAEALGIAESTVEAIIGMANEYGAEIKIGVEQQSLDELVASSEQAAQEASDALKSTLGEDFEISYDLKVNEDGTSNAEAELEKLKAKRDEINNSDATVEVKEQGVEAVNAQIESLIREKIQLEQPAFMSLDTSQVSASMVDALGQIQAMQSAMNELSALNQMVEAGISVDSSDIDAAKAKVDEYAAAIQSLPPEVKVAIGIDADASVDDIKKSFEDGSVNIDVNTSTTGSIDKAKETLETITDKNVTLSINVDGDADAFEKAAEASKALDGVQSNYVSMTAKLETNLEDKDDQIKNLDEFAKAAKKLDGVSSNTVHLNAYLDSDIHGDNGGQLKNMDAFADAVGKLKDKQGTTEVRLNAYLDSDLHGDKEAQIDNLDEFSDAVTKLQGLPKETTVRLNAYLDSDIHGDNGDQLENMAALADAVNLLKDNTGEYEVRLKAYLDSDLWGDDKTEQIGNLEEFVDAAKKLQEIEDVEVHLKAYLDSDLWGDDKNAQLDNLDEFVDAAQKLQDVEGVEVHLKAYLDSDLWGDDKVAQLSNLDDFVEAAQKLQEVQDVNVHLGAYLDSDVWGDDKNAQLSNLDDFAAAASKLQGIQDVNVHIGAYLDSDLWGDDKAAQLGNLDAFASAANSLNGLGDVNVSVSANVSDAPDTETTDRLLAFASAASQLQSISNVNITVTANIDSAAIDNVKNSLQGLANSGVMKNYTANISVNVDSSAISSLQSAINNVQTKVVTVTASASGTPAVTALQAAIATVQSKTVSVIANVTGTSEVNALISAIDKVHSKSVSVTASVLGTPNVNALASAIASVKNKSVTISATYTTSGQPPKVNGTAHIDGTANTGKAFKQGKWGAEESGTALMGELGPELIVRGDKFFTVGDNGAGFYKYQKGDIIFNHKQTEELLKNGYVTSNGGRGRAFVEGTAFLEGKAFASLVGGWKPGGIKPSSGTTTVVNNTTNNYNYGSSTKSSSSSKSSGSSSSSAKKEADEFKESLDLIEIMIDRIERAIDSLDRTASSSFRSFSDRNNALTQQMQKVREEMSLQQQAYERYLQQAYNSGLSNDWANRIINGEINVELITDENLKDQIDDFQEWYEKALDAKDSFEDLNETLGELSSQRFENIQEQFEGILDSLGYEQSMVENYVDRAEVDGQFVSKNFYKFLQDNVHAQAEALREELKQLIQARDDAVNAGTVAIGGAEWNEMNKDINDVTVSIHELGTQWAEYAKAMRETEWDIFDTIQDRISGIADEAQFLIDLMSNKKLFEDNGQLTNEGMASIGLYGEQYNILMNQADRYAEEIKKLEEQMAKEPFGPDAYGNASNAFNQDIIDRYYELIEAQQEAILSAEDMKNAIKDMVEEGIDLELEHLDDLIDKYLEALQAQKD